MGHSPTIHVHDSGDDVTLGMCDLLMPLYETDMCCCADTCPGATHADVLAVDLLMLSSGVYC